MHGATVAPAGSRCSPISIGAVSLRTTSGSTGRRRSVSLITASTYSSSPASHLLGQPGERVGVAQQPLDGPRQRGRRRLVAGDEQGHRARRAAPRRSSARRPRGGACSSSERMSSRSARSGPLAAVADLGVDDLVDRRERAGERGRRASSARARAGPSAPSSPRSVTVLEHAAQALAQQLAGARPRARRRPRG